ncbi:hypothetical protein [Pseudoalteromonas luteoviolacea]|uniref:Uncharacterized protein n=1 Tax=Pseudoalteromonas luteoviolacea S4054 TaxID=1129367 RepID=A0A0F6A7S2_9GAMM|nr:hypothetical protein [Pseudoalteromonas luteoviolacea]AOT11122.1 hypothetical protein S4054249_25145 [Pseudoalteromonas luteoviolacea]AOT15714.1 hypothetical protein S40542_23365 [Pseudoalteromonas luteoviolacea]AOT20943.1 hypothetical protein S4054_25065 [Pseudoalteromonas luteoviolacea]KKE82225.1 hypothetical protein N479_19195 [Pseudoalteromonas luteoviolacea S4054]KZN65442.1 hypothetical protein N481_25135 [Pseudoalteromonas luteoviolacea S4047-1]
MSDIRNSIYRCVHPIVNASDDAILWQNKTAFLQYRELVKPDDKYWQVKLDPCSHEKALLHSLQIYPTISFEDRTTPNISTVLTLELEMQDPNWEFADIIFVPQSLVNQETENMGQPTQPRILADVNLANKRKAIIRYNIEAGHPLTDLSLRSAIFEFFIRGKNLKTGHYHTTDGPNTFALDFLNHN